MNEVCVVYWSGTGNTEAMAEAVVKAAGGKLFTSAEFKPEMAAEYDAFAFGCPAMGAEVLEEDEFQPMFDAVKSALAGKRVALFGSYGWGDGEWMRSWEDNCRAAGIELACESVICQETPDADVLTACEKLGEALRVQ